MEHMRNNTNTEKLRNLEKNLSQSQFIQQRPTQAGLGLYPVLSGDRPATSCLSHGMAFFIYSLFNYDVSNAD
jgi:hypothetical protein